MRSTALLLAVVLCFVLRSGAMPCPCSNTALCAPLQTPMPAKEVFAFQVDQTNWPNYDWSKVTTVALFGGGMDPKLLCYAHERNVRLVLHANFDVNQLQNTSAVDTYIRDTVNKVEESYIDGINIDFESPIESTDTARTEALTSFVKNITAALRYKIPQAQVTFDVAWNPNHVDGRYYNYSAIMEITDFVVIMDYDTRSQVFSGPPCYAGPNTPLSTTHKGIHDFLALLDAMPKYHGNETAAAAKLVLGVPWYGYTYPCINTTDPTTQTCQIESVPFRGVQCSDAAGGQVALVDIMQAANNLPPSRGKWKLTTNITTNLQESYATFNYIDLSAPHRSTTINKMYFDTPTTLAQKYTVAKLKKLRGISMWNVDMLSNDKSGPLGKITKDMWDAMDSFLK